MLLSGRQREPSPQHVVAAFHWRDTPAADGAVVVEHQVRLVPQMDVAPYRQSQQVFYQRAARIDARVTGVAIVAVFLEGMAQGDGTAPFLRHFLGYDID